MPLADHYFYQADLNGFLTKIFLVCLFQIPTASLYGWRYVFLEKKLSRWFYFLILAFYIIWIFYEGEKNNTLEWIPILNLLVFFASAFYLHDFPNLKLLASNIFLFFKKNIKAVLFVFSLFLFVSFLNSYNEHQKKKEFIEKVQASLLKYESLTCNQMQKVCFSDFKKSCVDSFNGGVVPVSIECQERMAVFNGDIDRYDLVRMDIYKSKF